MMWLSGIGLVLVGFGCGFVVGYSRGRSIGWMVGEELERRKWKRAADGEATGLSDDR